MDTSEGEKISNMKEYKANVYKGFDRSSALYIDSVVSCEMYKVSGTAYCYNLVDNELLPIFSLFENNLVSQFIMYKSICTRNSIKID